MLLLFLVVNPASQLLLSHSIKLSWVALPVPLLILLRSEEVISKKTQSEITQGGNLLVGDPLRAICVTVAEDQKKLRVLADILKTFEGTVAIGSEILEDYSKYFDNNVLMTILLILAVNRSPAMNQFKVMNQM